MRRVLIAVLVTTAAVLVLVGGLAVGTFRWWGDGSGRADPEPRGLDTLDLAAVGRLSGLTVPAGATDLHTEYDEGIDYRVAACFTLDAAARPDFVAQLPALEPVAAVDGPAENCAAPTGTLLATEQHRDGPVFRTVTLADPGTGSVTVYVTAFTT